MRRKDREMPPEFAYQILDRSDWGVLSVVDPTGNPYGVPLQFVREENILYFHSASRGFKLDCLEQNPQVCITVADSIKLVAEEFTTKYQSGVFRGKAEKVEEKEAKVHILQLLCQRYAPSHAHLASTEISAHIAATSIWKIEITEATGKEHK